ncbi:MAG: hypothetical protein U1F54_18080 [Burkholderiales bacterium]
MNAGAISFLNRVLQPKRTTLLGMGIVAWLACAHTNAHAGADPVDAYRSAVVDTVQSCIAQAHVDQVPSDARALAACTVRDQGRIRALYLEARKSLRWQKGTRADLDRYFQAWGTLACIDAKRCIQPNESLSEALARLRTADAQLAR